MSSGLTPGSGQDTTGGRRSRRMAFRVLGALFVLAALACIGVAVADLFATGDMPRSRRSSGSSSWGSRCSSWAGCCSSSVRRRRGVVHRRGVLPAMRTAAQSLGLGGQTTGRRRTRRTGPYCRSCGRRNEADARFCDGCGTATGASWRSAASRSPTRTRRAGRRGAGGVHPPLRRPGRDPAGPDDVRRPGRRLLRGVPRRAPVAMGGWRMRPDVTAFGRTVAAEIKRMYVAPPARRAGLARRMLDHLEATARAAGADLMVLETGIEQPEAIALYESSGYAPVPGFGHPRGPRSRATTEGRSDLRAGGASGRPARVHEGRGAAWSWAGCAAPEPSRPPAWPGWTSPATTRCWCAGRGRWACPPRCRTSTGWRCGCRGTTAVTATCCSPPPGWAGSPGSCSRRAGRRTGGRSPRCSRTGRRTGRCCWPPSGRGGRRDRLRLPVGAVAARRPPRPVGHRRPGPGDLLRPGAEHRPGLGLRPGPPAAGAELPDRPPDPSRLTVNDPCDPCMS